MILESVENGPLLWPTVEENRVTRPKKYSELSATEAIQVDCDVKATNIILQGLPLDVYALNSILVSKPHNKTPYELLIRRSPNLHFMRLFGCHVTILNTLDHLGKFERKADEGFLVGYFVNWKVGQEKASDHEYILLPFMPSNSPLSSSTQCSDDKDTDEVPGKGDEGVCKGSGIDDQERTDSSTQDVNTVGTSINIANTNTNIGSLNINTIGFNNPSMLSLEEIGIFDDVYDDREVGADADINNL
nr:ribonuclease H-like domain-containing protein [Tanacetum cinerariifolium]